MEIGVELLKRKPSYEYPKPTDTRLINNSTDITDPYRGRTRQLGDIITQKKFFCGTDQCFFRSFSKSVFYTKSLMF